jgi:hypothetical protein
MNMKVIVAILLIAAMPVYAQAQSRSAGKVEGSGVPNWDVTASCRGAAEMAQAGQAGERQKSCFESENRARERLAADWSTFPAEDRTKCIKSIEWFNPTYTELAACLETYGDVKKAIEDATPPNNPR